MIFCKYLQGYCEFDAKVKQVIFLSDSFDDFGYAGLYYQVSIVLDWGSF